MSRIRKSPMDRDFRFKPWLPKNKVPAFKILFNKVRGKIGTYNGARDYIGLSCQTLDGLEKGEITADTGKKILTAYNKLYN